MTDETLRSDLCRQLAGYFGDVEDAAALALLRRDIEASAQLQRIFRDGIDAVLLDPSSDCLTLVQKCANRQAQRTPEGARAWLSALRRDLFERDS